MTLPKKDLFHLPDGVIYLDGNSLGPLPRAVPARLAQVAQDEWGAHLIRGWNVDGWMGQPVSVADRVGAIHYSEPADRNTTAPGRRRNRSTAARSPDVPPFHIGKGDAPQVLARL